MTTMCLIVALVFLACYCYSLSCRADEAEFRAEQYCRYWHAAIERERAWAKLAADQTGTIARLAGQRRKLFDVGRN